MPTKVRLVKALVFPVVMYGCESWTVKKAEHRRIDVFELWCWRRLLRVPWTAHTHKNTHTHTHTHTHMHIVNMNEPRSGLGKTIFMSRGN